MPAREYNQNMRTKLVVFGITGDLSRRKLLPALDRIISTGDFDDLSVIGVSRRKVDVHELIANTLGSSSELSNRMSIFSMASWSETFGFATVFSNG
ncbi:hypothetical protein B7Z28_01715 [Candidatus Saccharibacteria bacterium 32-45-3]|nr:MAG: hypothetical protein B7Z28_01715 [Candidatus Saccharibacteria bacterium 32-45-3]